MLWWWYLFLWVGSLIFRDFLRCLLCGEIVSLPTFWIRTVLSLAYHTPAYSCQVSFNSCLDFLLDFACTPAYLLSFFWHCIQTLKSFPKVRILTVILMPRLSSLIISTNSLVWWAVLLLVPTLSSNSFCYFFQSLSKGLIR